MKPESTKQHEDEKIDIDRDLSVQLVDLVEKMLEELGEDRALGKLDKARHMILMSGSGELILRLIGVIEPPNTQKKS